MPAAGYFFEIEIRVSDFRDAKLAEQRIAFANDVNIVAVTEKCALGGAVGNRSVAKKFHVAWQRRWRRRRRNRWSLKTTRFLNRFARFFRWRRGDLAEQIAAAAFVLGLLAG